jgi:hypothetical protein
MKQRLILTPIILTAFVLGTGSAYAQAQAQVQPTNAVPTNAQPVGASQSLQAQATGPGMLILPSLDVAKPNEIVAGKLTYSGIAVQAIKAKNLLQLFNPAAPARYGSGQDNAVNFPFSGAGPRLKFFSIDF